MEKLVYLNNLYDLYGILLTEKQQTYFEEYYSNGVANWQPKSGSANDFDLGYPGNDYTTAYIRNIRKDSSYISLPSDGGDININCGKGGTYHTNYGDINFNIGNGNKLNLQPSQAVFNVNVVCNSSSNLSLGTNTNAWYEGWIQYLKTYQTIWYKKEKRMNKILKDFSDMKKDLKREIKEFWVYSNGI